MTRRRYSRSRSRGRRSSSRSSSSRNKLRLRGGERTLFIMGAILYVVGLFGALELLTMTQSTITLLLAVGGGLLLVLMMLYIS